LGHSGLCGHLLGGFRCRGDSKGAVWSLPLKLTTPCSGWEPAVQVRFSSGAVGGWLPPLMVIVRREYERNRDVHVDYSYRGRHRRRHRNPGIRGTDDRIGTRGWGLCWHRSDRRDAILRPKIAASLPASVSRLVGCVAGRYRHTNVLTSRGILLISLHCAGGPTFMSHWPNHPASGNGAIASLFQFQRLGRAVPEPVRSPWGETRGPERCSLRLRSQINIIQRVQEIQLCEI